MAAFSCETRDPAGKIVKKTVDADSQREAIRLLESDGLFPIHVQELSQRVASVREQPQHVRPLQGTEESRVDRRLRLKELRDFTIQLAGSQSAGVPILTALKSIGRQLTNPAFQAVIEQLGADVEGGLPLSEAMRNHPKAFPQVYSSMIAAGEESGTLDEVLNDLAEFLEAEIEVRADVRSALLYPAMVVGALTLAVGVLTVFVVPRFATFYSGFQTELPLPTRVLIGVSRVTTEYSLLVLAGLGAMVYILQRTLRTRAGRRAFDHALLQVPVVKNVLMTASTLHVARMIGLFTRASVPIVQGLRTIAMTSSSMKTREALEDVSQRVASGEPLAESLELTACLPPSACQMLATGEATGSLDVACFTVAQQYKKELRYLTKNLATFIEPLLTLALAAIVLFVALAVFLPMWDLVKVVK